MRLHGASPVYITLQLHASMFSTRRDYWRVLTTAGPPMKPTAWLLGNTSPPACTVHYWHLTYVEDIHVQHSSWAWTHISLYDVCFQALARLILAGRETYIPLTLNVTAARMHNISHQQVSITDIHIHRWDFSHHHNKCIRHHTNREVIQVKSDRTTAG